LRAINTTEEQIAGASHEFLKFVDGLSELRHMPTHLLCIIALKQNAQSAPVNRR
jgi:hypothetical protein